MRFRPEQHLRRQSDIRTAREHGRRVDCRAFTIWWLKRAPAQLTSFPDAGEPVSAPAENRRLFPAVAPDLSRVCVIASTAAVGNAIQRARAKRRLREVFRQHQSSVPAGCDLLLIARAAVTTWPLPELGRKFVEACRQIEASASTRSSASPTL